MNTFIDLRVVVTGGASGIGAAVTAQLLARGARVAVLDLTVDAVAKGAVGLRCDVADRSSVQQAVDTAAETLGGIDVVVNNAGVGALGTVADNDDAEWSRVLDVNVTGIARVSAAALPHLRRSRTPAIVNTSSIAATHGLPDRALYSASKGAVAGLTRAMAADHLREGIRVNCVSPGTADTPWVGRLLEAAPDPAAERKALEARQPHGRLVTAEEVAASILFLADPANGSTSGTTLPVDSGMHDLLLRPAT
ncbi:MULTISPECIES: SDR family NAD(P)-dependent oxidoreductase [Kocuria]|uniref:SDR family NAD(P)-dependent oxidoreductase n=1 Tax=Kocuria TaxID=57493 RepID=UPI000D658FFC|nr:SDR family oxidoreductase [Kocuria rosea]MCC5781818.1 short-chain dehydrogenase [Kocuria sp. CCUG 69068]PWF84386.1 short-chain dehydrogenase [Kocuria rosea]